MTFNCTQTQTKQWQCWSWTARWRHSSWWSSLTAPSIEETNDVFYWTLKWSMAVPGDFIFRVANGHNKVIKCVCAHCNNTFAKLFHFIAPVRLFVSLLLICKCTCSSFFIELPALSVNHCTFNTFEIVAKTACCVVQYDCSFHKLLLHVWGFQWWLKRSCQMLHSC